MQYALSAFKNGLVWRRRKNSQGQSFSTYQIATLANIQVSKRSRLKQAFDRYKLFESIYISFKDEKSEGAKHAVYRGKKVLITIMDSIVEQQVVTISSQDITLLTLKIIKQIDYYTGMPADIRDRAYFIISAIFFNYNLI